MPEANTMETAKKELVDSFIKYITGVYILQQDFIDDMQGGLQSMFEKYSIYPVGSEPAFSSNADDVVEHQEVPKKTRKKSTKKEITKAASIDTAMEQNQTIEAVTEAIDIVENVEAVETVEVVETVETVEAVEAVEAVEEPTHIPSHVEIAIQQAEVSEKKPRKPRTKKETSSTNEPKKKRGMTAYRAFVTEFSQMPETQGMTLKTRGPMMSDEWAKIKDDPEKLRVYEQKADAFNKENGL
jgi:hypothetical protein